MPSSSVAASCSRTQAASGRILAASACRFALCAGSLIALILVTACGTYRRQMAPVRELAARGELEQALKRVGQVLEPGQLLYHLESGLLLHLMGRYAESERALEEAELLVEELYTQSLSRKGLSYLLADDLQPYAGERYERVYVNYYRALNQLHLGDLEGALVEARKIDLAMAGMRDRLGHEAPLLPAFPEYLAGLLHESGGDRNAAMVSLRVAGQIYAAHEERFGRAPPAWLHRDLLRVARRGGFRELAERLEERGGTGGGPLPADHGEIVFLLESGWVPARSEIRLSVPLLETEKEVGEEGILDLAVTLQGRYRSYLHTGRWLPSGRKVVYWLVVALPVLPPAPPASVGRARIRCAHGGVETVLVEDLETAAREAFASQQEAIFLRAAVRALLKYAGHRVAREEGGEVLGMLANVAGVATERADTRGWTTLPRRIHMARLVVPAGSHELEVELLGPGGEAVERVDLGTLDVGPGRRSFVNWRWLE